MNTKCDSTPIQINDLAHFGPLAGASRGQPGPRPGPGLCCVTCHDIIRV